MITGSVHPVRSGGAARLGLAILMATGLCTVASVAARADCQEDIGKLMQRRMAAVAVVNKSKGPTGKLDPVAACPRLRTLAALESEASAYLVKNKDWCNLPADFVDKMTESSKKTATFATQACGFAVKMKQMQQQQAQQQQEAAPKLPAGPL